MTPTYAFNDGVKVREILKVFVHCSDSSDGNAKMIDRWHKERGWDGIGYHWVVCKDGKIEKGRPDWKVGAHARGHNKQSIGVCLIGKDGLFTIPQIKSAVHIVKNICRTYYLSYNDIHGHYEVNSNKTCPGFKIENFRVLVRRD